MSALDVFQFQGRPVRTIIVDGEPWFVARDVASILGYADTVNAIKQHSRGVVKHHPIQDALGRTQDARVIAEPDVLRLIIGSRLPAAQDFERWVFEDVLPTIRRTGRYGSDVDMLAALPSSQLLQLAAKAAERAELAEAKIAIDAPKVHFAEAVASSTTTILVGDLAKLLRSNGIDIGANRLFDRLRDEGFLIRRKGSDWNMPTQRAMDLGLFEVKESTHQQPDGTVRITKTPKVTGKGQQYFINRYAPQEVAV